MSRSGYSYEYDRWSINLWRGAVDRSIGGKRGQAFLKEMIVALDTLPVPRLIEYDLETEEGEVCALGAVGRARGLPMSAIEPEDSYQVADVFKIARAMGCEIEYINDECGPSNETPEARFKRVRAWVVANIRAP